MSKIFSLLPLLPLACSPDVESFCGAGENLLAWQVQTNGKVATTSLPHDACRRHCLLSNSNFKKALWEFCPKGIHLHTLCKIGTKRNNTIIFFSGNYQPLTKTLSSSFLFFLWCK
jgi:hypothetical protein